MWIDKDKRREGGIAAKCDVNHRNFLDFTRNSGTRGEVPEGSLTSSGNRSSNKNSRVRRDEAFG